MLELLPMVVFSVIAAAMVGIDAPAGAAPRHTNRLIDSASPYLLQHAHNPVDWYPWGDEAFKRAREEDKPILLSVGYAACHWCHVMEHESFENEAIAAILNRAFISIKVDREERPDIDDIYMAATQAMTGRGGWPMTVFMTPDGKPFHCGTYYPPDDRGGRRGFRSLCTEIGERWRSDRAALLADTGKLIERVAARDLIQPVAGILQRPALSRVVERLATAFDPELGGRLSRRNKFPPTMAMEAMLREFVTHPEKTPIHYVDLVETTLRHMRAGGIYDHLGGGICRYSTDPRWFAPHFEKMLYDQATASGVYLSAYQLTRHPHHAEAARGILDYCLADLQDPKGGFYSARDADSEGEEGKYYVWTHAELSRHLSAEDLPLFCAFYNVTPTGNWEHGRNILYRRVDDSGFAPSHGLSPAAWTQRLAAMHATLLDVRGQRVPPLLDDKVLVEWNGLVITSLARAHRILNEPRYGAAAERAAQFILTTMRRDGRLYRAHRRGHTHVTACATDYTALIEGLLTLYETTGHRRWLDAAAELNDTFIELYHDTARGGFFYTAEHAEPLLVRSKNLRDGVVPSANSTAVLNCLKLAIHLRRPELRTLAEETLRYTTNLMARGALERMLWAALFYHHAPREVVIVGSPDDPATEALIAAAYERYLPNKVVAIASPAAAAASDALPLLVRKTLVEGQPAVYVCQNYLCRKPETDPAALKAELFARLP